MFTYWACANVSRVDLHFEPNMWPSQPGTKKTTRKIKEHIRRKQQKRQQEFPIGKNKKKNKGKKKKTVPQGRIELPTFASLRVNTAYKYDALTD